MSNKVSFFSFEESDRHIVARIKGRAINSRYYHLNFKVQDLLKRWKTQNDSVIRQAISKSIFGASRTIVFVGKETHKSYWVGEEIKMTIQEGKPVYAIYLRDKNVILHPELIKNKIHTYKWSEKKLQYLATK